MNTMHLLVFITFFLSSFLSYSLLLLVSSSSWYRVCTGYVRDRRPCLFFRILVVSIILSPVLFKVVAVKSRELKEGEEGRVSEHYEFLKTCILNLNSKEKKNNHAPVFSYVQIDPNIPLPQMQVRHVDIYLAFLTVWLNAKLQSPLHAQSFIDHTSTVTHQKC